MDTSEGSFRQLEAHSTFATGEEKVGGCLPNVVDSKESKRYVQLFAALPLEIEVCEGNVLEHRQIRRVYSDRSSGRVRQGIDGLTAGTVELCLGSACFMISLCHRREGACSRCQQKCRSVSEWLTRQACSVVSECTQTSSFSQASAVIELTTKSSKTLMFATPGVIFD